MKKLATSFIVLLILLVSCNQTKTKVKTKSEPVSKPQTSETLTNAQNLFAPLPETAENKNNPVTAEKVALGKALYFDKILSKNQTESCNTCHNLDTYGVDNKPVSPGDKKGVFGNRNSPTTLNAAFHIAQFWDGREPDVEAQAGGPVLNPVEMGMPNEQEVEKRLSNSKLYKEMFAKAFPNDKNPVNYENMKKAIGAFERKLVTPSRFDAFLKGDESALSEDEKKGLDLFISKGCASCHSGALLGGNSFQKFGVHANYWEYTHSPKIDNGRYDITKNEADKYVFKVPSLRNIEKTYPYFHDGSVKDLSEAVKIMGKVELNQDLSDEEVASIVTFLKSLTGKVPEQLKKS